MVLGEKHGTNYLPYTMKAIYLDYKKFEIGGAKSVKKRKVILM